MSLGKVDQIVFALISLFLLSPFGWDFFLKVQGLYVPEIFLIFVAGYFFIYRSKHADALAVFTPQVYLWLVICLTLLFVGTMFHGDFIGAYGDFRSSFLLGFVFLCVKNSKISKVSVVDVVFYVSFMSLVFQLMAFIFFGKNGPKFNIATPIIISCVYASMIRDKGEVWPVLLLSLYLSVVSGFRSNLIICFLLGGVIFLNSFVTSGNMVSRFKYVFTLFSVFVLMFVGWDSAIEYISKDESLYHQLIYKSELLINRVFDGGEVLDEDRAQYLPFIFNNFEYFLLPSGFGYDSLTYYWRSQWMSKGEYINGSSIDTGFGYLSAHFGLVLTMFIVLYLLKELLKSLVSGRTVHTISFAFVFLVYFFVFGGHVFTQVAHALGAGLILGMLFKISYVGTKGNG